MHQYDYQGLDLDLLVWATKLDCEGAAILSAERLLNDPRRHPLIINVEMTPKYMKERGGVGPDVLYRELKAAGYTSSCPGYAAKTYDAKFMEANIISGTAYFRRRDKQASFSIRNESRIKKFVNSQW
jgi:hypothetical protein